MPIAQTRDAEADRTFTLRWADRNSRWQKYREVATDPTRTFRFHTGRGLAARLGYAVESFAAAGQVGPRAAWSAST